MQVNLPAIPGGYYEEAADADSTETERTQESEPDKSLKDADYDEHEKDDAQASSDETAETTAKETQVKDSEQATETEPSDEEQTSETGSSLRGENEETEAAETETEERTSEVEEKAKDKSNKAAGDKTYTSTYNFADESIVSKTTDGIGPESSSDGKLTVSSSTGQKTYRHNGDSHGIELKPGSQVKIHVLGNAKVFIGGCKYSGTGNNNGPASVLTVTSGETEVYKCEDTKTQSCYNNDTVGLSFEYTGDETDLVMTFSGEGSTYVPIITVERTEPAVTAKVTLADENSVLKTDDTIKLVNKDDADDSYDITSATTETEFQLRANATYNIVSSNKKIKATSDNKTTITTETAAITVTVNLEADESADQGPTKTYTSTYDFRDGSIVPKDTDGKGTVTSADKKLTVASGSSNAYGYNGVQHGTKFSTGNTITIHVLGKAKVFIGSCKYSKGSLKVTSGETEIANFASTTSSTCYDTDKTQGMSFTYDGDETDLVLTFDTAETYVPVITVERTEPKADEVTATVTINDENTLLQETDTITLVNTADEENVIDVTNAASEAMELTLPANAVYNIVSSNSDIEATFEGRTTVTTTTEDINVTIDLTATVVNPTVTISADDAVKDAQYTLTLTNQEDSEEKHELENGEAVKLKIGKTYQLTCSNADVDAKINSSVLLNVTETLAAITVTVTGTDTTHHTYDVWDFGAEALESTGNITYNNRLTADIINSWYPGKPAGSVITQDDAITTEGEDLDTGTGLKLISNNAKKKWRLRGLKTNTTITSEQNEGSLTDEFGAPYQGIMYDNAGSGKMWMTLDVKAGDMVTAVVSSNGTASTITWESPSGMDKQTYEYTRASRTKLANTTVFTASEDGAYKLYTPNEKLVVARIYRERPSIVTVSGKIIVPSGASWENDSELIFTNRTTGVQTKAEVTNASGEVNYTVKLHEQYSYDVSVEGIEGCVVGANNKLTLPNEAGDTEFEVSLITVDLVQVTGSLADLTPEAAAKVKIAFKNEEKVYVPKITIDAEQVTYTGKFEKGVEYAVEESNINDYTLETKTFKADDAGTIDIRFTKKPVYAINVTLEGPTAEEAAQTKLTFSNIDEEGYEYEFTGTQGIELRDGQYAVKAVLEGYTQKVTSDVKVSGAAVDKTIVMLRNGSQEVAYKETITVGSDNTYDYQSINDALEAVRNMKRENDERVTISIAPGDLKEFSKIMPSAWKPPAEMTTVAFQ